MKKYLLLLLACCALNAMAQQVPNRMKVEMKSGDVRTFNVEDIDCITFFRDNHRDTGLPALKVAVPTDFSESSVLKVTYEGTVVAEICREYIKPVQEQRVVLYPMGEDGKADLTAGLSLSDGGSVVWNVEENTVDYQAGSAAPTEVYIEGGQAQLEAPEGEVTAAVVAPELIEDTRNGETTYYRIVKIGTQFWMAENLAAKYYLSGEEIPQYSSVQQATWKALTTGACHVYGDNEQDLLPLYGRLYNGYAVQSDQGLAPEGWEIPTIAQWQTLKSYGGTKSANYKDDTPLSWSSDGEGNNLTGFTALPGGYYMPIDGQGDVNEGADAWFWSSTEYYDALTKSTTLNTARMNNVATGFVIYSDSGHSFYFGHSVRCVRK